jgi:hypothetical protein
VSGKFRREACASDYTADSSLTLTLAGTRSTLIACSSRGVSWPSSLLQTFCKPMSEGYAAVRQSRRRLLERG